MRMTWLCANERDWKPLCDGLCRKKTSKGAKHACEWPSCVIGHKRLWFSRQNSPLVAKAKTAYSHWRVVNFWRHISRPHAACALWWWIMNKAISLARKPPNESFAPHNRHAKKFRKCFYIYGSRSRYLWGCATLFKPNQTTIRVKSKKIKTETNFQFLKKKLKW